LLDLVERQMDAVRHRHHISQRETPDPYDEDKGLSILAATQAASIIST
jgi:hypothetical protein